MTDLFASLVVAASFATTPAALPADGAVAADRVTPHVAQAMVAAVAAASAVPAVTAQDADGHYHEGELGEKYLLIEHSLKCNCSCGLDVHSCQFQMQCGVSPGWSQRIRRQLEAGMDEEAIKAGFVADFGQTVLMAPPAEGFNLLGYFLPAAAILTAGMLVGLLVRRGHGDLEGFAPVSDPSPEDDARLRTALRELEERERPDW